MITSDGGKTTLARIVQKLMLTEIIGQDGISLNKDLPAKTTYLCIHLHAVYDLLSVLNLAVQCTMAIQ